MIRLNMMARETKDNSIDSVIELAHRLKLDGVDIHLSGMPRERDYLLRVKLLCLKWGLPIGYAGAGSFVGPAEGADEQMEQGKRDVDAAAFLGAQLLRVFARHKWPDTEAEPRPDRAPYEDRRGKRQPTHSILQPRGLDGSPGAA